MLERLGVAAAVDEVCGPRRADAAASVGTYLALATLNRVVAPRSKLAFAEWWATTAGPRWVRLPAAALDHRRFWDAMDSLDDTRLRAAERIIDARMVSEFGLDLSGLALDMTNFATFIDSANERAPIAQRGHAKQKRVDLRLVGLGLVVTRDGAVPVTSHAYPGNRPDVTQFTAVIDELLARYRALPGAAAAPTVVFDAGQNSAANFAHLTDTGLHYVTSLPPSDHPGLLALPARRRRPVDPDRFGGLSAFDTRTAVFGVDRRVVLTHSPTLHEAQARGFAQTVAKATRCLAELTATLDRGRARRSREQVQAEIDRITRPRWLTRVLATELTGHDPSTIRLSVTVDPAAQHALETEIFGKRVLVTDRDDWPVADVVAAYRSQSDVEAGFRQLKDPHLVGFSPMFHWTEAKIRVHVFSCVLALAVAHLMRRHATHAGLTMSVRDLLTTLAGIQETVLLYPGERGRPRAQRLLTDTDSTQRQLYALFRLDAHAPRR
jgi:transposase